MWLRGEGAFEDEVILLPGRQLVEFQHFQAEQIRQVMRIAGIGRHVVFVHQAGVERGDQGAAVLDVEFQPVGFPA